METPKYFTLVAAASEGPTRLNAFDNALLKAGIGNLNLVKISSILPPRAAERLELEIAPGSLVPTAYGAIESDVPGELISAAVGVGIGPGESYGVIMEFSGRCGEREAEAAVSRMLEEAFKERGIALERKIIRAVEHRVVHIGCALAAVALWG